MLRRTDRRSRRALHDADELVARGQIFDAIAALTEANRDRRHPDVERRLVELRLEAFPHLAPTTPEPVWPPEVPDLFPDTVGPPEVTRAELTPETLRSAIFHHGSVLVRGLIDAATVDRIVAHIDRAFVAHDEWARAADGAPREWFAPLPGYGADHRAFARQSDGVLAVESPPAFFALVELFDDLGIRDLATAFLGEPPLVLANKWTLRRQRPDAGDPDWHQDGAFMGQDIRSLDLWLALSDCGEDAPGLDLVARRLDRVVATGTDGARLDWTVGPGMVERVAEGTIMRPNFSAGDAMLFDHLFLHRTGIHPGMTRTRYALETWFAAPSSYPPGQIPIAY